MVYFWTDFWHIKDFMIKCNFGRSLSLFLTLVCIINKKKYQPFKWCIPLGWNTFNCAHKKLDTILNAIKALIVMLALTSCKTVSFTISTIYMRSSDCFLGLFKIPTFFILTAFVIFLYVPCILVFMAKWKFP